MKILHLEDHARDAALVRDLLTTEWSHCHVTTVATRDAFIPELVPDRHDLILSDFVLPGFTGRDALTLARAALPDTPFIFLSGTFGEDVAVEMVRIGAADYLLKDRMHRLPLAISRALHDRDERRRRRHAEARVREQADLLDQARDGIVVTDLEDRVLFWNRGATRMFGWTAAETVSHESRSFFGQSLAGEFNTMQQRVDREGAWHGELRLENKFHHVIVAEIRATLIHDEHGRAKSRLLIVTDITEKKTLEAQFLRAQRLESLGMLAAGISHDLNNVLAPILMGAPLLRSLATNAADLRVLDTIEKSAARGAALVRQILSFAQGSSGSNLLIQPKHLLRDVAELVQQTFPKTITLETDIPRTLSTVSGNPTQLHQVLLNLCVNARDAMPHGGQLRLAARDIELSSAEAAALPAAIPGSFVRIEVSDTGTGIASEILARIWEPFFTTKGEEGTGLGLATVRGIAANHGGFATVDSALGRGSAFHIYLPATRNADEIAPPAVKPNSPTRRGRGELILVVDDEDAIRTLLSAILRRDGYRVVTAANGIEASEIVTPSASHLHLVLTDLSMPEMGGVALAEAIRKINPAVKILFMSGATGAHGTTDPLPPDAPAITKPFTPEELLTRVRAALDAS